jgi:hypothetical protein
MLMWLNRLLNKKHLKGYIKSEEKRKEKKNEEEEEGTNRILQQYAFLRGCVSDESFEEI